MDERWLAKYLWGTTAGAGAYLLGLLLTVALVGGTRTRALFQIQVFGTVTDPEQGRLAHEEWVSVGAVESEGASPGTLELAGWLYHEVHRGTVELTASAATDDGTIGGEPVNNVGAVLPPTDSLLQAVPAVLLVLAGLLALFLVSRRHAEGFSWGDAIDAGFGTAIGYGGLALASALLFTWSGTVPLSTGDAVTVAVRPAVVPDVLVAGLGYPVVFGTLGALVVATYVRPDTMTRE